MSLWYMAQGIGRKGIPLKLPLEDYRQDTPFCKGGCLRSRQGDFNNPLFSLLSSLISKVLLLTNVVARGIA